MWLSASRVPPRSWPSDHLCPFAMGWALPTADYYEHSVTLELALCRPSHVPVVLNVLARRRCPIHPLECARCTSPITRRVRPAKLGRHARDGTASRRGRSACAVPPLEMGIQAVELSPYHAGLAGPHHTRLLMSPASPTCSCPLWLSPSGKSDDPEAPLRTSLDSVEDSAPRPAAHTFTAHGSSTCVALSCSMVRVSSWWQCLWSSCRFPCLLFLWLPSTWCTSSRFPVIRHRWQCSPWPC